MFCVKAHSLLKKGLGMGMGMQHFECFSLHLWISTKEMPK